MRLMRGKKLSEWFFYEYINIVVNIENYGVNGLNFVVSIKKTQMTRQVQHKTENQSFFKEMSRLGTNNIFENWGWGYRKQVTKIYQKNSLF